MFYCTNSRRIYMLIDTLLIQSHKSIQGKVNLPKLVVFFEKFHGSHLVVPQVHRSRWRIASCSRSFPLKCPDRPASSALVRLLLGPPLLREPSAISSMETLFIIPVIVVFMTFHGDGYLRSLGKQKMQLENQNHFCQSMIVYKKMRTSLYACLV